MTDKQFNMCLCEAMAYTDIDAYVSDMALSSMWGDEPDDHIPLSRLDDLARVWQLANITVKEIRHHTGLTQAEFAERFCIPKRTIENWESNKSECAIYIRLMLAKLCNI